MPLGERNGRNTGSRVINYFGFVHPRLWLAMLWLKKNALGARHS
jgi:hypothetical protein